MKMAPYVEEEVLFHLEVYYGYYDISDWCLWNLRKHFPRSRIVVVSDGDPDERYSGFRKKYAAEVIYGEHLWTKDASGVLWKRRFDSLFRGKERILFRIDSDVGFYRKFSGLPIEDCLFGTAGAADDGMMFVQGGIMGITRGAARRVIDSGLLHNGGVQKWNHEWNGKMMASDDREMCNIANAIRIPVVDHPEIMSRWKDRLPNPDLRYAAVHPCKDGKLQNDSQKGGLEMIPVNGTLKQLEELARDIPKRDPRPKWLRSMMRNPENKALYPLIFEEWKWGRTPEEMDDKALYYRFLYSVADMFAPSNIIDIGTCIGWSAIHLAAGNKGGMVTSIDVRLEATETGSRLAKKFGVFNVNFINSASCNQKTIDDLPEPIDILFIDGEHKCERVSMELNLYGPKIRPGGIILIDDIALDNEMKAVWKKVGLPKVEFPWLHEVYGCSFGAFIKP